jgi:hypothetical protein
MVAVSVSLTHEVNAAGRSVGGRVEVRLRAAACASRRGTRLMPSALPWRPGTGTSQQPAGRSAPLVAKDGKGGSIPCRRGDFATPSALRPWPDCPGKPNRARRRQAGSHRYDPGSGRPEESAATAGRQVARGCRIAAIVSDAKWVKRTITASPAGIGQDGPGSVQFGHALGRAVSARMVPRGKLRSAARTSNSASRSTCTTL